jgi:plastocyanin
MEDPKQNQDSSSSLKGSLGGQAGSGMKNLFAPDSGSQPGRTKNSQKMTKPPMLPVIIVGLVILVAIVGIYDITKKSPTPTPAVTSTKAAVASANQQLPPAQVSTTAAGFVPETVTVKVGQGIVWTNTDTQDHQVASDPYPTDNALQGFNDTQKEDPGAVFEFVFNKAGTYTYHDDLNPYKLKGTIIVK